MALWGVSFELVYTAWDTTNNVGKTGDSGNHTLKWIKDGTASTANDTTPTEIDATNAKGEYKITMTATEAECVYGKLAGVSATSNIVIIPVGIAFERLPNAAPGASGGLPTVDASNYIAGMAGTINTLDSLDTAQDTQHSTTQSSLATAQADLDTITGSDGVTLSTASTLDIWHEPTSGIITAGTIGLQIKTNLDVASSTLSTLVATDILSSGTALNTTGGTLDLVTDITTKTGFSLSAAGVTAIWDETGTDITAVPAVTGTLVDKIDWLFALSRNKFTQTATVATITNDAGTAIATSTPIADDGTTFTRPEWS